MRQYTGMIPQDLGEVSIDIINPATDKHISKYEDQTYHMARLLQTCNLLLLTV